MVCNHKNQSLNVESHKVPYWDDFFFIYINDLASVLDSSLPILFADGTNLFEIGNNFQEMNK